MCKLNILIIGSGHYSTGSTVISDSKTTDKDFGVLLPSVLELRSKGIVGEIAIVARDGVRLNKLTPKFYKMSEIYGWDDDIQLFPNKETVNNEAYIDAIKMMPKPCAALIAVPDSMHTSVMSCCIDNDMPFMVVKPAVTNLDDLYFLLDKLKKNAVLAMVDYHKVYDDANILIKNEYQNGLYGNIQHYSSLMTQRRDMIEIFGRSMNAKNTLNVNHYLGSHYMHTLGFMTNATPIDVRAIAQYGVVNKMLDGDANVADIVETQVRWAGENGDVFTSYHISGWNDPKETESMTYQEVHILCENGHIDSDQRDRGIRKVISGQGYNSPNPYFFDLNSGLIGNGIDTKYGFISIKTFIDFCIQINNGNINL